MRLNRQQQRAILAAMLAEARRTQAQPITEIVQQVQQVRDDAISAARQGFTISPTPEGEVPYQREV